MAKGSYIANPELKAAQPNKYAKSIVLNIPNDKVAIYNFNLKMCRTDEARRKLMNEILKRHE